MKTEITARSRIARTLGLGKPLRGASIPSVYKPVEPSLGLLRADIGAASLSLFGDPYELDPCDRYYTLTHSPQRPGQAMELLETGRGGDIVEIMEIGPFSSVWSWLWHEGEDISPMPHRVSKLASIWAKLGLGKLLPLGSSSPDPQWGHPEQCLSHVSSKNVPPDFPQLSREFPRALLAWQLWHHPHSRQPETLCHVVPSHGR